MNFKYLFIFLFFSLSSFLMNAQNFDGKVCNIINVANDKPLSVVGSNLGQNGGRLHSWPLSSHRNLFQEWKFIAHGEGYHIVSMTPQTRSSNYLEVSSHEIGKNGGKVQLWDNHHPDHLNKIWKLIKNSDGSYCLTTVSNENYVVEIADYDIGKNGGGKIHMWENKGHKNQKWWIKIKE